MSTVRKLWRACLLGLGGLALFLWVLWTALTLYFANLSSPALRATLALAYVGSLVVVLSRLRPWYRGVRAAIFSSVVVALVYVVQRPSNDREWLPDVAVTPTVEIDGDRLTVHGVRNFTYRSENDFDPIWEERTYDLAALRSLDLLTSYWGPTDVCHTFLSFGFEGGEQLAVSVEARKERGEAYSTLGGFFKQYELLYVFGDERDLIGVRTNHRGEDVYLWRLRTQPERLRSLLVSYADFASGLARAPQFYNVLRNSCGVNILHRASETGRTVFVGRAALLNGYWAQHLYDAGALDRSLPFEELRERCHVNARASGDAPDFSRRIREVSPRSNVTK